MLLNDNALTSKKNAVLFFFALILSVSATAQVYQHNFGSTPITANPYTGTPNILDTNLSGSSWTHNSAGPWLDLDGSSSSTALSVTAPTTATTAFTDFTLTFNVASGKQLDITSFNFWRRRTSGFVAPTWSMTINGIAVGNGSVPTTGLEIGETIVLNPVTGLEGTVTIIVRFNNSTNGTGGVTIDDFTLNGTVTNLAPPCSLDVTSFFPTTGPENTLVTLTGTGFTDATGVTFDGVTTTFSSLSDTEIIALVPAGVSAGNIVVTSPGCTENVTGNFNLITSECQGEIYISEVYDNNGGSYGVIELYNPTSNTVTFGNQYVLERYGNIGDPSPAGGYILTLPGSIAPYSTYLVSSSTSGPTGCPTSFDSNIGNGINANDELKLKKNGTIIDVAYAPTYIGYTVKRNADAVAPSATQSWSDWTTTSNTCTDLGSHTANGSSGTVPNITHPLTQYVCENATATFSVSISDTETYTYQWKVLNSAGNWVNITNNANYSGATSYTLDIQNIPFSFNGNQYYCEITSSTCDLISNAAQLNITEAPEVDTAIPTATGCATGDTGTITITAVTSEFGLSYSIDGINYSFTNVFTNLAAGNYTVTIKNLSGCVSEPVVVTVGAGGAPDEAVIAITQPTCTTPTGTITITPQTGSGIEYSIDNGVTYQTSNIFAGYAAGNYTVVVRNDAGCVSNPVNATIDATPNAPADATITSITQPTCTTPTGTITIATQTGSGIEYSIDNGVTYQSSNVFTGYVSGNYAVVVRNDAGCVSNPVNATIDAIPNAPADATITSITQPTCTTPTGTITIATQTGSGIEYSIDNGVTYQTSNIFAGYSAGNYTVVVRNDAGCVSNPVNATIDAIPNAPADATITSITQPTCTTPTGTITIATQIGSGIEYSIDNGVTYQTSNIFAGYAAGNYTVVVRNDAGCVSNPVNITIDAIPTIPAPQFQITPLGCNETTGTIEITAPLGPEYTYRIDNDPYQSSTTFTGYSAGNYTITAKNTGGCTSTITATINPAPATPADADVSFTQPSCTTLGSITINSPIGAGLTYSIDNGATYQSTTNYTSLPAGNYTVLVKNAAGCISANPQTVTINPAPTVPAAAGYTSTNPTCATPTGSITITSPIDTNLEYSIDNGNTYSTNVVYNNLAPNLYQIVVRNTVTGCTSTTINVTINPAPNVPDDAVIITTQPGCTISTGSITIQSPLGAGYTYSIDGVNYQPLTTFYGITPGNYFAYVKNAAGCISAIPTPFTINSAPVIPDTATVAITNPDCTIATGSIEVTAPLGADLAYTIDGINYQTSPIFTDLTSGNYTIRVQNSAGCISLPVTKTIQSQPATPTVPELVVTQTDCFNDTGRIVVTSPIGIYTYSIDGGVTYQATTTFTNLVPDDYIITVRNNAGCTEVSESITINPLPTPAPDPGVITGNTTICEGETTQLTNDVLDGTWSSSNDFIATVDENGLVTSLSAGAVTINYTVGTECTDTATMIVNINPIPNPTLEDIYYICQDLETEEYNNVMINSGLSVGNHSFVWKKGETVLPFVSGFLIVDEPGEYSVEATNLTTGCVGSSTTTVNVSSIAIATAEVATDFSYKQTITVNVTGGSGNYEFSLNGGLFQDDNIFSNITEGVYTITINDKNGCDPLVLEVYALNYPRYFTPNGDGTHETWNIKGLSNQQDAIIYIFDRYGKVISVIKPGQIGWDGTYNGEKLPATDYWFKLLYQSSNGTNKEFKAHFSLLR